MRYSELVVWQKAMDLVEKVYVLTEKFPAEEKFGLTSQMRRAAVSIPVNITEGHGRKYTNAFQNHLSIASGSLMEVETLLQISKRLGLIENDAQDLFLLRTDEVGKMLSGLRNSLAQFPKDPKS